MSSDNQQSSVSSYEVRPLTGNSSEIVVPHGELIFSFDAKVGWFLISNFDVKPGHRGRGIGKQLLRVAIQLATELDAQAIVAGVTSREAVASMSRVFGSEALTINELGDFDQDAIPADRRTRTSAELFYQLDRSAPPQ